MLGEINTQAGFPVLSYPLAKWYHVKNEMETEGKNKLLIITSNNLDHLAAVICIFKGNLKHKTRNNKQSNKKNERETEMEYKEKLQSCLPLQEKGYHVFLNTTSG